MSSTKNLLLAILSMDSYNRGYGTGITGLTDDIDTQIGTARVTKRLKDVSTSFASQAEAAGFYAISYDTDFGKVIAYRGTDENIPQDVNNGYGISVGHADGNQAKMAAKFYQSVSGGALYDTGINVTGNSLGGGLSGFGGI
ncbi:MAG: hypothetical protein V3V02_09875 [Rhizobiaceae bacterium]